MNSPLVLLGGAGLGDWVWDGLRERLAAETAVGAYPKRADAGLDDYADAVLAQVEWPRFTLLAHSLGGVVASQLVSRAPERVTGVLGVSAVIPAAGASFLRSLPRPQGLVMGLMVHLAGTRPPEKQLRDGLAAGLPAAVADRVVTEFAPESKAVYRDRVSPRTFPSRTGYVTTTRDHELPAALQERYLRELGTTWTRSLDTGHLPMLEDPDGLAQIVTEFQALEAQAS